MTIDWKNAQANLGVAADGIAGPNTWRALFRRVSALVGHKPDQGVINSLATSAIVHLPEYEIVATVDRLADFMAQTAHECAGYTVFVENLNYSAAGLLKTWPSRFTAETAAACARQPQKIAGIVYGDRMGNLSAEDGWRFRGQGMLQATGRANYEAANKRLGLGLDTNPEIAAIPGLSLLIACDFYREHKVLDAVDAKDWPLARRRVNGGSNGLAQVNALRADTWKVLAG